MPTDALCVVGFTAARAPEGQRRVSPGVDGNFVAAAAFLEKMWRLIAVFAVAVRLLVFSSPAAASCAAPAPTPENAARAEAVVDGTVTNVSAGAVTLRVDRVLKGQVGRSVRVFGTVGLTSIDYRAELGSDHVLYLVRRADGQLETNACIGSHTGPPNASEGTFFGLSSSSGAPSATITPDVEPLVPAPSVIAPAMWAAFILAIIVIGFAALSIARRRRASTATSHAPTK